MTTLHTFGCSITQGFALPDVVRVFRDDSGRLLTAKELIDKRVHWEDIHLYQPSEYAWPAVLGHKLNMPVQNHARRGACFQQISRQCAVSAPTIRPSDIVIVMWTYLSRVSMQWPARTTVPFCNIVDPQKNWQTFIIGFNKFFGLSSSDYDRDQAIKNYIENYTKNTYLDPKGIYNHSYNNLVLQTMTHGFLTATGARVIHLSVEPDSYLLQLDLMRQQLDPSLQAYTQTPHPDLWYTVPVDHDICRVIHDPAIPPAENDMHPSVQHHKNFAHAVYLEYFQGHKKP